MKHTHKYRRINIARKGNPEYWVMHCQLPGCSHYIPMKTKLTCPALIGKEGICNKCGCEFNITLFSMTQAKPTCTACKGLPVGKSKANIQKDEVATANKFLEDLSKNL